MSKHVAAITLAATLALLSTATAQFAGPGLSWLGTSGTGVRGFVPSCTGLAVAAVRGEGITVTVWGDVQAPFVLLLAPSATQCIPLPGLGNALMLDFPIATFAVGVLTRTTPCLSCPPGYEDTRFAIPPTLPPGFTASFQAVSSGAGRPSFTVAITATIR
ncbi:MAG: hypothetical protein IPM29_26270 [Planctomycetes bacterium]|nr:hypothetical protein [Planctomycetota bacterium]